LYEYIENSSRLLFSLLTHRLTVNKRIYSWQVLAVQVTLPKVHSVFAFWESFTRYYVQEIVSHSRTAVLKYIYRFQCKLIASWMRKMSNLYVIMGGSLVNVIIIAITYKKTNAWFLKKTLDFYMTDIITLENKYSEKS